MKVLLEREIPGDTFLETEKETPCRWGFLMSVLDDRKKRSPCRWLFDLLFVILFKVVQKGVPALRHTQQNAIRVGGTWEALQPKQGHSETPKDHCPIENEHLIGSFWLYTYPWLLWESLLVFWALFVICSSSFLFSVFVFNLLVLRVLFVNQGGEGLHTAPRDLRLRHPQAQTLSVTKPPDAAPVAGR